MARRWALAFAAAAAAAVWLLLAWRAGGSAAAAAAPDPLLAGGVFRRVIPRASSIVAPDLRGLAQYRTSQLVFLDGEGIPSRRILYVSSVPSPAFVVVLGLDSDRGERYLESQLADKVAFAERHGYGLYCRYLQDTAAQNVPFDTALGIGRMALLRQAMAAFPAAKWFWHIDEDSVIMTPARALDALTLPAALEEKMLRGVVVAPAEPHIRSYKTVPGRAVSIIVSRDDQGLNTRSMLVKNDLHGRALLEYASDPLNRDYAPFQSGSTSPAELLTHLTTWHPRFMGRLAVVNGSELGSYEQDGAVEQGFRAGHFVYLLSRSVDRIARWQQRTEVLRLRESLGNGGSEAQST